MELHSIRIAHADEGPPDVAVPPIEDVLAEIAARVPAEEWARLPEDLTDHIDHYLYGTPKQ